jgi:hypothetical protein
MTASEEPLLRKERESERERERGGIIIKRKQMLNKYGQYQC